MTTVDRPIDHSRYSLIIEWSDEDQVYIATAPELPGCRTHGSTRAEAAQKGEEAIEGWLEAVAAHNWPLPAPRTFDGWSSIPLPEGAETREAVAS
jgi:predicted RNase H-like HicB family nuclease